MTITDMIQDELDRLEAQQTKEFYEQPGDSGAITAMTATYPNPQTEDKACENQNEKKPILEWTVDRGDNVIFQQCAFFNGARLASDDGWDDGISSGGTCNDVAAGDVGDDCSYTFDLGDLDVVSHHHHQDLWPADSTTVDVGDGPHDLGEISTPDNWELSFTVKIDDGGLAFDDKWNSIIHVADAHGESPDDYYPALFFYKTKTMYVYQTKSGGGRDYIQSTTVFEAGKTYDVLVKNVGSKISIYIDGQLDNSQQFEGPHASTAGLLKVGWSGGKYPPAAATISNARFSEVEALVISKHSYCVEAKFCPPDSGTCDGSNQQIKVTTRCTTGLQYDGTPMDVFPRMLGKEGVSISWLDTRFEDTSGYRVYKYDASVPFAEDTSARLLKEISLKKADCGLTHNYLDFRDIRLVRSRASRSATRSCRSTPVATRSRTRSASAGSTWRRRAVDPHGARGDSRMEARPPVVALS